MSRAVDKMSEHRNKSGGINQNFFGQTSLYTNVFTQPGNYSVNLHLNGGRPQDRKTGGSGSTHHQATGMPNQSSSPAQSKAAPPFGGSTGSGSPQPLQNGLPWPNAFPDSNK